jgi:DNA-binding winged helix-turn-helix (wHTH) protein
MPDTPIGFSGVRPTFELEGWTVEPDRNTVTHDGRAVRLEPKVMDVLVCLADHAGQVVPRRTLVDTVWATEFISDTTLTHAIADLRRAFADNPREPRFIETIPKRGYRLVAPVIGPAVAVPMTARAVGREPPLAVITADQVQLARRPDPTAAEHLLLIRDREINLVGPEIIFGRGPEAAIQILSPDVSRRHARLELAADGPSTIADLGSKNGTEINRQPIDGPVGLASGDVIDIGPASFIFRNLAFEPTRTRSD